MSHRMKHLELHRESPFFMIPGENGSSAERALRVEKKTQKHAIAPVTFSHFMCYSSYSAEEFRMFGLGIPDTRRGHTTQPINN